MTGVQTCALPIFRHPRPQTDARADRPLFDRPYRRAWFSRFRNTKKGLPSWQSFARQATANGAERYSAETPKGPPRLSVAGTACSREPTRGQTDRFLTALTAARGSAASATQKKDCPLDRPFFLWRRERDLNPRYPCEVHTISSRAP